MSKGNSGKAKTLWYVVAVKPAVKSAGPQFAAELIGKGRSSEERARLTGAAYKRAGIPVMVVRAACNVAALGRVLSALRYVTGS